MAAEELTRIEARIESDHRYVDLLPHFYNSLGAIRLNLSKSVSGLPSLDAIDRALEAFKKALQFSEQTHNLEVWGAAHFNIGNILAGKHDSAEITLEQKYFLRISAIAEFSAAIESFSAFSYPFHYADAQLALGRVLFEHATCLRIKESVEAYLFRAVQSFEAGASVLNPETSPNLWAENRMLLAAVISRHAEIAEAETAISDLKHSIVLFEEAGEVYSKLQLREHERACKKAAKNARQNLTVLEGKDHPIRKNSTKIPP